MTDLPARFYKRVPRYDETMFLMFVFDLDSL